MTPASIEQRFREIAAAVGRARQVLAEGDAIDFAGFDQAITEACTAAAQVGDAERPALLAAMIALAREMEQLAAELRQRQGAARRPDAIAAYRSDGANE
jgi:uncharacterized membrane-anchored protein